MRSTNGFSFGVGVSSLARFMFLFVSVFYVSKMCRPLRQNPYSNINIRLNMCRTLMMMAS